MRRTGEGALPLLVSPARGAGAAEILSAKPAASTLAAPALAVVFVAVQPAASVALAVATADTASISVRRRQVADGDGSARRIEGVDTGAADRSLPGAVSVTVSPGPRRRGRPVYFRRH